MLVRHRESDDPRVAALEPDPLEVLRWSEIERQWIAENRTPVSNTWFSTGRPGTPVAAHPWIEEADLVHLHWVPGLLSAGGIGALLALGKPVVWTLHDEWAYTGGCHYAAGCERWRGACDACPQIARDPHGLVAAHFADKRELLAAGRLAIVAPSRWLSSRAAASAVLGSRIVRTIPYGIELDVFEPSRREAERARLGVADDELLLLFAASDARERRKGFAELVRALERCAGRLSGRVGAIVLGWTDERSLPIPTRSLGHLDDDRAVAAAIAACDLYVIPSLEDNLPNGALEALACGTPVAGFAAGGIPEIVAGQPASLLAQPGDAAGLAERLLEALADPGGLRAMRPVVRSIALERYALERQARDYAALYRGLVAGEVW